LGVYGHTPTMTKRDYATFDDLYLLFCAEGNRREWDLINHSWEIGATCGIND
jgi:hypothetical protein